MAEAQTLMIAGSDMTRNTACALLYWFLRTRGVVERIRRGWLDGVVEGGCEIPEFGSVRVLPL